MWAPTVNPVLLYNARPGEFVAKLAEAAGLKSIRVDDPSRIGAAWDEALAEDGPVLVEFMAGYDFPRPSLQRFIEQGS